jgi:hypothetical protein
VRQAGRQTGTKVGMARKADLRRLDNGQVEGERGTQADKVEKGTGQARQGRDNKAGTARQVGKSNRGRQADQDEAGMQEGAREGRRGKAGRLRHARWRVEKGSQCRAGQGRQLLRSKQSARASPAGRMGQPGKVRQLD